MRRTKRSFDVVASLAGLVVASPLLALIALVIWLDDRAPVLFRQQRVGEGGRLFPMLKFRTMIRDAERAGPQLTIGRDSRITRSGRFLRRSKLDELPQLINVLRGDMSLVGPRPEVPRYVAMYSLEQRRVLELRPGITDPASAEFVDEARLLSESCDPERTYIEEIMPRKLQLNLEYAAHASVGRDVLMILRTFGAISRPGATSRR
jgi:lipopolysaccharide/colanic/teichoic acid biosynthesis glycosyltransferase